MVQKFLLLSVLVCLVYSGITVTPEIAEGKVKIMPLQEGSVVLAFGDSITFGTGAPKDASYPSLLQRELKLNVVNAGVPGELISEGALRLPGLLEEHMPSLVMICHGGNDILRGREDELIEKDLAAMAEMVKATPADLVIIGVPRPGLGLMVPDFYEKVAERYGALYEGQILRKILSKPELKSDLIHPNAKGYELMAKALAQLVKSSQW